MASFVFSIVITFQIWACHVTCVYKLSKNFISRDTFLNFRKVTKYERDTCTGSRLIKDFRDGIGLKCSLKDFVNMETFLRIMYSNIREKFIFIQSSL